jgi:hypothetical protein
VFSRCVVRGVFCMMPKLNDCQLHTSH